MDLALLETGGAGSMCVGVVEAMVFPVCVGGGPPGGGAPDFPRVEGEGPGSRADQRIGPGREGVARPAT
ncbi:hypothetical protein GCM10017750_30230 [Streptomyces racemochromogenes]